MAKQSEELKEISHRLKLLEVEMLKIHRILIQRGILQEEKPLAKPASKEQEILSQLFTEGVWRHPTSQELKLADAWKKLPDAEKQSIVNELRNLRLKPTLSEIINLNRAGRTIE